MSIIAAPGQDGTPSKAPNSPSSAFAALSLDDNDKDHNGPATASASSSSGLLTPAHLRELDASTALVSALDAARNSVKPLIRSTGHLTQGHHLLSWKVAEFAYRKSTSLSSELPTLARGLFTERLSSSSSSSSSKHRIVVRGYDKFFNLAEMPWTKPATISHYTTPPYVLTFKENGCIIFISSLSPTQLVVTSKHSLGSIEGTEVTHAQKGHEWLLKHLASVGKTEEQLAKALWERNETAAFELCDDSFEEHVLAYSSARSGLHLHGLNSNAASFSTRDMPEVDAFAKEWGFIPTRWITLPSLEEVQRVTAEIEQTGAWEGEPIEGFVIRTHMPDAKQMEKLKKDKAEVVSPPYAPGQAWFYKVKFDEPYLMYRDWRELARKMVKEKQEWEAKIAATTSTTAAAADSSSSSSSSSTVLPSTSSSTAGAALSTEKEGEPREKVEVKAEGETGADPPTSKAALKRERKRLAKAATKTLATQQAAALSLGLLPPPPPQPRSKRPETLAFITWCYDRLYGNPAHHVSAQPHLFTPLAQNKGIIAMREAFLAYLSSNSSVSSGVDGEKGGQGEKEEDEREYTKTVLAPIAVPGAARPSSP